MPRALNLLRLEPAFRRECFTAGLIAAGYEVVSEIKTPRADDVLLTWNRKSSAAAEADRFAGAGAPVLVAENAYVRLRGWYALALDHHAGRGRWAEGDGARWDALGVDLMPWRTAGAEVVILGQRSIGEKGIASPQGWEESIRRKVAGRIRRHPGRRCVGPPLEQDLRNARAVVTWGSSAALQALLWGIPVFHGLHGWIGESASRHVDEFEKGPLCDDAARLAMFRRLAWSQAPIAEIRSGEAFRRLMQC